MSSSHMFREHWNEWRLFFPKEYEALVSFCDQVHVKIDNTLGGKQNVFVVMDLKQPDFCSLFSIASYLSECAVPEMVAASPKGI